jgi:hypothetical protein
MINDLHDARARPSQLRHKPLLSMWAPSPLRREEKLMLARNYPDYAPHNRGRSETSQVPTSKADSTAATYFAETRSS